VTLPGFFLANSISSRMLAAGRLGRVTSIMLAVTRRVIGRKSRTAS
jgi:hypothetical protein